MELKNKRFFQCPISGVMMEFEEFRDEMRYQEEDWEKMVREGLYVEMRLATPEEIEAGDLDIYGCSNPKKYGAYWVKVN